MLKAAFLTCYFLSVPTATLAPAVFVPERPAAQRTAVGLRAHPAAQAVVTAVAASATAKRPG